MTVAVTGASGAFGRAAARRLLEYMPASGIQLTTRTPSKLAELATLGVTVREANFDGTEDSLAAAFDGADTLLIISTLSVGRRVKQHSRAVAAAARAGVRHVVYTSFVGVPGSTALVATEHAGTEEMLAASGLAWTFLRNSWYMEAITDVIAPMSLAQGVWRGSAGDGRTGMVSRDDCVAAAVGVLTSPGHEGTAYAVTGPQALSCPDAVAVLAEVTGRPLAYQQVTDDVMYARFDAAGVPRRIEDAGTSAIPWCSDDMVSFERAIRQGELDIVSDAVQRLTGTAPRSFREVAAERCR